MYAVVQIGANQYKVAEGETIAVGRIREQEGNKITLDKVLLVADGDRVTVGQPFVAGAKISATVAKQALGDKVVAYKYRIRKDSAQKIGHRQKITTLNITKISAGK